MVAKPLAVVIGLDSSPSGQAALRFATWVARRRRAPLRLVRTFEPSHHPTQAPQGPQLDAPDAEFDRAVRLVDDTLEAMRIAAPDVEVWTRLESGSAARVLLEESGGADLIVLGSRGSCGLAGSPVGSTTLRVASLSHCPVIAVPAPADHRAVRHGVVVGVDGSESSEIAIEFAFQSASEMSEDLVALHAMTQPERLEHSEMVRLGQDPALVSDEERVGMAESMAGWSEKFPDVGVEQRIVCGNPVHALVGAAENARLLVVGSHGRGARRGSLLGSVSRGVLQHGSGPVAVVHPHAR